MELVQYHQRNRDPANRLHSPASGKSKDTFPALEITDSPQSTDQHARETGVIHGIVRPGDPVPELHISARELEQQEADSCNQNCPSDVRSLFHEPWMECIKLLLHAQRPIMPD